MLQELSRCVIVSPLVMEHVTFLCRVLLSRAALQIRKVLLRGRVIAVTGSSSLIKTFFVGVKGSVLMIVLTCQGTVTTRRM